MRFDVLPSHHPRLNVHDSAYQSLRDQISATRFRDPAEELAFGELVASTYRDQRAAPLIRTAARVMLNLHGTQQAVADAIGIDRSCLSVAKDHGDLGSRPLAAIFAEEPVLRHVLGNLHPILCEMGRAGFMAAARQTYAHWHRMNPEAVELDVALYEDLCRRLPTGCGNVASPWRDVFVYVFATVEGIGAPSLWWPTDPA